MTSNKVICMVDDEMKKGEPLNSPLSLSAIDTKNNVIIADPNNLMQGEAMSNKTNLGYFIIPRSLSQDTRYQGARLKYKHVLQIILENVAYYPTTHAVGSEIFPIQIGQLCISERHLVDLCNKEVRFKEDMVDKNIVHRAVHFWRGCHFVNQEVIHDKTLITVTIPDFYVEPKNTSEPQSEPKVNQNRTTKIRKDKKEKNVRKENTYAAATPAAISIFSFFVDSIKSNLPEVAASIPQKEAAVFDALLKLHDPDKIRAVIHYAHTNDFWKPHVLNPSRLKIKFDTLNVQLSNPIASKKHSLASVTGEYDNVF